MQSRDKYWDVVKGLAIILVALGHSIQFGGGQDYLWGCNYFSNKVLQLICSFHMPLFMIVCGYFFHNTLMTKPVGSVLISKLYTLVIPILTFSLIKFIVTSFEDGSFQLELSRIPYLILTNLWFLWAVLFCDIVTLIIEKLHLHWSFYIAAVAVILVCPNDYNLCFYAYMLPFFVVGMYSRKTGFVRFTENNVIGIISLAIFVVLAIFYSSDTFVYTTGTSLVKDNWSKQLLIDSHRWAIGFAGSVGCLWGVKKIKFEKVGCISYLGLISMGIYCWQDTACRLCFHLTRKLAHPEILWWSIAFVIIFGLSLLLTWVTRKFKFLNFVLYGGR